MIHAHTARAHTHTHASCCAAASLAPVSHPQPSTQLPPTPLQLYPLTQCTHTPMVSMVVQYWLRHCPAIVAEGLRVSQQVRSDDGMRVIGQLKFTFETDSPSLMVDTGAGEDVGEPAGGAGEGAKEGRADVKKRRPARQQLPETGAAHDGTGMYAGEIGEPRPGLASDVTEKMCLHMESSVKYFVWSPESNINHPATAAASAAASTTNKAAKEDVVGDLIRGGEGGYAFVGPFLQESLAERMVHSKRKVAIGQIPSVRQWLLQVYGVDNVQSTVWFRGYIFYPLALYREAEVAEAGKAGEAGEAEKGGKAENEAVAGAVADAVVLSAEEGGGARTAVGKVAVNGPSSPPQHPPLARPIQPVRVRAPVVALRGLEEGRGKVGLSPLHACGWWTNDMNELLSSNLACHAGRCVGTKKAVEAETDSDTETVCPDSGGGEAKVSSSSPPPLPLPRLPLPLRPPNTPCGGGRFSES